MVSRISKNGTAPKRNRCQISITSEHLIQRAIPRRPRSVNNLRATLKIVWRIAIPYFRSEDRRAGRWLLAAVIAVELSLVANDVVLNQWRNRFYNALQEKDWD